MHDDDEVGFPCLLGQEEDRSKMASDLPLAFSPTHPPMATRQTYDPVLTHLFNKTEHIGEMVLSPLELQWASTFGNKDLRVTSFSPSSERCLPLLVLHTIGRAIFKLAPSDNQLTTDPRPLTALHMSCLHENKVPYHTHNDPSRLPCLSFSFAGTSDVIHF